MQQRNAEIERQTTETRISLKLKLDGSGQSRISTSIGFLDHMLVLLATHGLFDLEIQAQGDTWVDQHHTVEDVGICLGRAFARALGDKKGIRRFGHQAVPMDEALALVAVDLSGRAYLACVLPRLTERVGELDSQLIPEFFRAFALQAGATVHIRVMAGSNSHHIVEAIFKAWARALKQACELEPGVERIPSSKGVL